MQAPLATCHTRLDASVPPLAQLQSHTIAPSANRDDIITLPLIGERSISVPVSICLLSVCLSASISPELHVRSSPNFMHVIYVRSSVLLWGRCDKLRTSGFMDGVMFVHRPNGQATQWWLNKEQHGFITVAYTQTDPPGGSTGSREESDIYDSLFRRWFSTKMPIFQES